MSRRGAYQKKEKNVLNVRARHNFLINGIALPASVEKSLHAALVGQRVFAALDLPKLGITPIALNTMKSLAEELFIEPDGDGLKGFDHLNALRVRLNTSLAVIVVARTAEVKTVRAANKTNQLTARLAAAELQCVKRQKAYLSLYTAINGLIGNDKLPREVQMRIYRLLENHHSAFSSLFEPNIDDAVGIDPQVAQILKKLNKPK